jgi:transcriptional regulator with XRE-family HTH domain
VKTEHVKARARIEELGLRYDRVAQKVGLTPDRFNHILEGRRPVPEPTEDFYTKLAEALFCDAADPRRTWPQPDPWPLGRQGA